MRKYLESLPAKIKQLVAAARETAAQQGVRAYLVGGCVRDMLFGAKNFDLDIAVEGDGIAFAKAFALKMGGKVSPHLRFGTARVSLPGHLKVDIATCRREEYPQPACLPIVRPGNLRDDLWRRDFTLNAMAVSINAGCFGRLVDYFAGCADLRQKRLRALHSRSFFDDPTRILRLARFAGRYGFGIEPATLRQLRQAVNAGMLEATQPQRIREAVILLLQEREPLRAIAQLKQLCGFAFISKKIKSVNSALLSACRRQIAWFCREYPTRRKLDNWLVYLMAILDALSYAEAKKTCGKFCLRKGEEKRILSAKKISRAFLADLSGVKISAARIAGRLEPLSYEAIIFLRAKYKNKRLRRAVADFLEVYNGMRLCVGGEDLLALGIAPGPRYQKILALALKAKLNGKVRTKEEELSLIRELLKGQGRDGTQRQDY
jgi:tRNA nucleotidyltransferase (CCA-adding enzyme)